MSVLTGYGRGGWNSGPYGQTDTSVSVTGVSATGAIGSVTVTEGSGVTVSTTGVSATGEIQGVLIWGLVDDSQSITYSAVDDSQTITYSAVDDSQSINWEDIAA